MKIRLNEYTRLVNDTLNMASELITPTGTEDWERIAVSSLDVATKRSSSMLQLIDQDLDSCLVLMRSIFELAVTVEYLSKDPSGRVPLYLKGIEHQSSLPSGETHDSLFRRTLPPFWKMCGTLEGWAKLTYDKSALYEYSSDATHSGAWTTMRNHGRLAAVTAPDDFEKARLLNTSLFYLLEIGDHVVGDGPDSVTIERWRTLKARNSQLMKALQDNQ